MFFFFLATFSTAFALKAEEADYRAIPLIENQFLELIDRDPYPNYVPIKHTIKPYTDGFCYIHPVMTIRLSDSWGVWSLFDYESENHFQVGDEVWLVAMTEEEKSVYPSKRAYFSTYFQGDIVVDYPFTHWIIPKTRSCAFPAVNTQTESDVKLDCWDY